MKNRLNVLTNGYSTWRPCNWGYNLRHFFRTLKWGWQRMTRGYADVDVWWLGDYVQELLSKSIVQLAQTCHGYPGRDEWDTPEKWEAFLLEMAEHFKKGINIDADVNFPDPYFDELYGMATYSPRRTEEGNAVMEVTYEDKERAEELHEKWRHFLKEQCEAVDNESQKGFEMLAKSIRSLWDQEFI